MVLVSILSCVALLSPASTRPSRTAAAPPFFDTDGRLERTAAPPVPPLPAKYVPVYNGDVLVTPSETAIDVKLNRRRETLMLGAGLGGPTATEVDQMLSAQRIKLMAALAEAPDMCTPTFLSEAQAACAPMELNLQPSDLELRAQWIPARLELRSEGWAFESRTPRSAAPLGQRSEGWAFE